MITQRNDYMLEERKKEHYKKKRGKYINLGLGALFSSKQTSRSVWVVARNLVVERAHSKVFANAPTWSFTTAFRFSSKDWLSGVQHDCSKKGLDHRLAPLKACEETLFASLCHNLISHLLQFFCFPVGKIG